MTELTLYSRDTFSACTLTEHPLYHYIKTLMMTDISIYIRNITNSTCYALESNGKLTLVVVASYQPKQAYPTSLRAQYLDYAQEELDITEIKGRKVLSGALACLKWLLPNRLDNVVYVGNFLLSTNLFESYSVAELSQIERLLSDQFPNCSIVYRSQNVFLNETLMANLSSLGYQPFISRQVYIADQNNQINSKKSYQKDRSLARRTSLVVKTEFDVASYAERIIELYSQLYLDKYSLINPQYTKEFIMEMIKADNTSFTGIFDQERLVGVTMTWSLGSVITVPILGYDLSYPQKSGIYRLLTYYTLSQVDDNCLFHMSSGVGPFKLSRGATYFPEFLYYKRPAEKGRLRLVEHGLNWLNQTLVKLSEKRAF